MSKSDQHVVPYEDGWAVKSEGSDLPTSVHQTKSEAIDEARTIAQLKGVEFTVYGAGGQPLSSPAGTSLDEEAIRAWGRDPSGGGSWSSSSRGGAPTWASALKKKSAAKKSSAKKSTAKKAATKGKAASKGMASKSASRGSAARKSGAKKSSTKKAGRK